MMKSFLRPHVEWILRRLPVSRAAFAERDSLVAQLRTSASKGSKTSGAAKRLGLVSQVKGYEPRHLEELFPTMRSTEERVRLTLLCRDADVLPRVTNAGAVEQQDDGTVVRVMHNGLKMLAGGYYGAWMQDLIARCGGVHEPQER